MPDSENTRQASEKIDIAPIKSLLFASYWNSLWSGPHHCTSTSWTMRRHLIALKGDPLEASTTLQNTTYDGMACKVNHAGQGQSCRATDTLSWRRQE